jgi:hypothetical protein
MLNLVLRRYYFLYWDFNDSLFKFCNYTVKRPFLYPFERLRLTLLYLFTIFFNLFFDLFFFFLLKNWFLLIWKLLKNLIRKLTILVCLTKRILLFCLFNYLCYLYGVWLLSDIKNFQSFSFRIFRRNEALKICFV